MTFTVDDGDYIGVNSTTGALTLFQNYDLQVQLGFDICGVSSNYSKRVDVWANLRPGDGDIDIGSVSGPSGNNGMRQGSSGETLPTFHVFDTNATHMYWDVALHIQDSRYLEQVQINIVLPQNLIASAHPCTFDSAVIDAGYALECTQLGGNDLQITMSYMSSPLPDLRGYVYIARVKLNTPTIQITAIILPKITAMATYADRLKQTLVKKVSDQDSIAGTALFAYSNTRRSRQLDVSLRDDTRLAVSSQRLLPSNTPVCGVYGDINGDGKVTLNDATDLGVFMRSRDSKLIQDEPDELLALSPDCPEALSYYYPKKMMKADLTAPEIKLLDLEMISGVVNAKAQFLGSITADCLDDATTPIISIHATVFEIGIGGLTTSVPRSESKVFFDVRSRGNVVLWWQEDNTQSILGNGTAHGLITVHDGQGHLVFNKVDKTNQTHPSFTENCRVVSAADLAGTAEVECHTLVDAVVDSDGTNASWVAQIRNLRYDGAVVYDVAVLTEIEKDNSRFSTPFISTNIPRPETIYVSTTDYTPVLGSPYSTLDNSSLTCDLRSTAHLPPPLSPPSAPPSHPSPVAPPPPPCKLDFLRFNALGGYEEGNDGSVAAEFIEMERLWWDTMTKTNYDEYTCGVQEYAFTECLDIGASSTLGRDRGNYINTSDFYATSMENFDNQSVVVHFGGVVTCSDVRVGDGVVNGYDIAVLLWWYFRSAPYDGLSTSGDLVDTTSPRGDTAPRCNTAESRSAWQQELAGQYCPPNTHASGRRLGVAQTVPDMDTTVAEWGRVPGQGEWLRIHSSGVQMVLDLHLAGIWTNKPLPLSNQKAPPKNCSTCLPITNNPAADVVLAFARRSEYDDEHSRSLQLHGGDGICGVISSAVAMTAMLGNTISLKQQPPTKSCAFDIFLWIPLYPADQVPAKRGVDDSEQAGCAGRVGVLPGSSSMDGIRGKVQRLLSCAEAMSSVDDDLSKSPPPPPPPVCQSQGEHCSSSSPIADSRSSWLSNDIMDMIHRYIGDSDPIDNKLVFLTARTGDACCPGLVCLANACVAQSPPPAPLLLPPPPPDEGSSGGSILGSLVFGICVFAGCLWCFGGCGDSNESSGVYHGLTNGNPDTHRLPSLSTIPKP